jgi:hypothetical protein
MELLDCKKFLGVVVQLDVLKAVRINGEDRHDTMSFGVLQSSATRLVPFFAPRIELIAPSSSGDHFFETK